MSFEEKAESTGIQVKYPVITIAEGTGLEESLVEELIQQKLKVTTAESCTGGLISGRLINVSGASSVIDRGFVTYANEAKEEELGVSHETLEAYGAVSSQTAIEMVKGAAKRGKSEAAIAVTGLAGPEGGTPEKPVGLVYIGIYLYGDIYWQEYRFQGTRQEIRELTVGNSIYLLQQILKERA